MEEETKEEISEINREGLDKKVKEEKIMEILRDDPLLFLFQTISHLHIGDSSIIALLILSGLSSGLGSRKLVFHVKTVGTFSKGKSAVQEAVSLMFNSVDRVTSQSPKAKFYKAGKGGLYDKGIMIFDESEGSQEAIVLERSLTDDKTSDPIHETVNDKKEFTALTIKEINAVWKNCAWLDLDD